jgi:hypothetical protein
MSVKLVRRAVDEPDAAPALLEQHIAELGRQRQRQDEAISDARALLTEWPEAQVVRAPEMTVVSKPMPGVSTLGNEYDWAEADATFTAAVEDVIATVESCGAQVSGRPWRSWAIETAEQKTGSTTPGTPIWLVKVPVTAGRQAAASLPDDVELQTFEARDELSISIPGRSSMAKFGTALSRLLAHPLEDAVIDMSRLRQVLHADGVEITMAIDRLGPDDLEERFPYFTHRARTVLSLAIDQAATSSSPSVGTGHLLLGTIDEGANLALNILQAVGIDVARVRRNLTPCTDTDTDTEADGSDSTVSPQFSSAATRALELAVTEARSQGYEYIGCEHVLLGLIGEPDGTAGQVLRALGAELGSARRALTAAVAGHVK